MDNEPLMKMFHAVPKPCFIQYNDIILIFIDCACNVLKAKTNVLLVGKIAALCPSKVTSKSTQLAIIYDRVI